MKKFILLALLNSGVILSQQISIPVDTVVSTTHETIIKGEKVKYIADECNGFQMYLQQHHRLHLISYLRGDKRQDLISEKSCLHLASWLALD